MAHTRQCFTGLPLFLVVAEKAEERKREQDILYERQLAKERAAGGEQPPAMQGGLLQALLPRSQHTPFKQRNLPAAPAAPPLCHLRFCS